MRPTGGSPPAGVAITGSKVKVGDIVRFGAFRLGAAQRYKVIKKTQRYKGGKYLLDVVRLDENGNETSDHYTHIDPTGRLVLLERPSKTQTERDVEDDDLSNIDWELVNALREDMEGQV